jgi:hypothetical protein
MRNKILSITVLKSLFVATELPSNRMTISEYSRKDRYTRLLAVRNALKVCVKSKADFRSQLAQDSIRQRIFVNKVTNLRFP